MGCAHSRVDKEETVRRCRERKRLMKQLIGCRAQLAAAHLDYLRSLKNTGATLRQLTEADVYSTSITTYPPPASHSPLNELLLPPPPPPPHVPQFTTSTHLTTKPDATQEDVIDIEREDNRHDGHDDDDDDNESFGPPPPPLLHLSGSAWEFRDPFGPPGPSSSNSSSKDGEGAAEDEDWVEADTEFRDVDNDNDGEQLEGNNLPCDDNVVLDLVKKAERSLPSPSPPPPCKDEILVDDNSSVMSLLTKDTDMALVVWRTKKSLAGIVKEIDDYFLKAAAAGNDVLLLLDSDQVHRLREMEQFKGKRAKSTKVFSALSWNWFFRSPQSGQDDCSQETRDSKRSHNHCATLEHLYAKEQRLYKEVKEVELVRVLHRKKTRLLQKLETREGDCTTTEEIRSDIENLHSQLLSLQESINTICLSISELRDKELRPQLTEFTFGLMQMWRMMYECHQVQNHIAQQANLLDHHRGFEPSTEAHRFATTQLEAEVTHWYNSFCNLLKYQRNYVQILSQWVTLTDCLPDTSEMDSSACGIRHLCEEWQLSLDRIPDKVASEAIKSFLSVIRSILLQQKEELHLQKKSRRLESMLEKELTSFSDLYKHEENSAVRCPVSAAKLEALKKKVEGEKSKYLSSVRNSRAMTLNNLQTGLPNVFQALMGFAGASVQTFERICLPSQTIPLDHTGINSPSF